MVILYIDGQKAEILMLNVVVPTFTTRWRAR